MHQAPFTLNKSWKTTNLNTLDHGRVTGFPSLSHVLCHLTTFGEQASISHRLYTLEDRMQPKLQKQSKGGGQAD